VDHFASALEIGKDVDFHRLYFPIQKSRGKEIKVIFMIGPKTLEKDLVEVVMHYMVICTILTVTTKNALNVVDKLLLAIAMANMVMSF